MKRFNKVLILAFVVTLAGACTKLQESPAPGSSTGSTNTGGGNTGNPEVYLGLWKQTEKKLDGASIFDADNTFTVKLDAAATAEWTYTIFGSVQPPQADAYLLKKGPPVTIDFTTAGSREVITKTGSQIVWQYNDPNAAGALVIETLTKQ